MMNERIVAERTIQEQRQALGRIRQALEQRIGRLEHEISEMVAMAADARARGHARIADARDRLLGTLHERLASARVELAEIPERDRELSARLPERPRFGRGRRVDAEPAEVRQERFERRMASRMREIEAQTATAVEAAARAATLAASERSSDQAANDTAAAGDGAPEGVQGGSVRERALAAGVSARTLGKLDRVAVLRPDLLPKIRAGELSVHKAAVEAGIEKAPSKGAPINTLMSADRP